MSTLLELQELRAENARLARIRALQESYGINFYVPHAKQDKFHSVGHVTGRYCRTGNRGGKTKCGSAEDVAWLLGGRVWYRNSFDVVGMTTDDRGLRTRFVSRRHVGAQNHELITKGIPQRPVKGLLLVNDWDKAKEIFTNQTGSWETRGELFQLIPAEALGEKAVHLSRGGHVDQIRVKRPREFGGGESLLCIDTVESWKHAKMSAESSDWDFIHLDEPCPEAMFTAHKRGLVDRGGKFWINCTPLDEMWINDEFCPPGHRMVKEAPEGQEFFKDASKKVSRFIITWSIWDNPHNNDDAIDEFKAGLNREQRACRLSGLPLAMAGLVYKDFIFDIHVPADVPRGWRAWNDPPKDYTIRVAWDVHQRIPQAILFVATAPDGTAYVYDELFFDPLIGPNATELQKRLRGRHVVSYLIDPFAVIPNAIDGSSVLDELLNFDLCFEKASKDLTLGISKVQERLIERRVNSPEVPTICFSPHLEQTLYEFTHYVYDSNKNEPKDADNHMMENLYRLVLDGLDYVPVTSDYSHRRPLTIGSNEVSRRL